jgi:hypothetical protein
MKAKWSKICLGGLFIDGKKNPIGMRKMLGDRAPLCFDPDDIVTSVIIIF